MSNNGKNEYKTTLSSKICSQEAKTIWLQLQSEIVAAQNKVNDVFQSGRPYQSFLKFLENNHEKLNIFEPTFLNEKVGYYGKLIVTSLMIPENGRLYFETAYYPTRTEFFGNRRIAISNLIVFSNHYMERLIERKNIATLLSLKSEILNSWRIEKLSSFVKEIGPLDLTTAYLMVYRDSVSFCDLEIHDNKTTTATFKTIITDRQFTKKQKDIVNFILDSVNSDACFLATANIPETIHEANNVIEDTKKRTAGCNFSAISHEISKNKSKGEFKAKGKYIKGFARYLEGYDPLSPKYKR